MKEYMARGRLFDRPGLRIMNVRHLVVCTAFCTAHMAVGHVAMAQTLAPRAYVITPKSANAVTFSWSWLDGSLNFNGAIPVTGATGTYSVPVVSYYHSFGFFGRSANVTAILPYGVGTFQGQVLGTQRHVYRSGLLDLTLRFSVNLKGGPAMAMPQFVKWRQKTLLGVSLTVVAPPGKYEATHLITWSINRWGVT